MQTNLDLTPLCVDLDGTLILADVTFESIVKSIKNNPAILFFLPIWLLKGRAFLKSKLLKYAKPKADTLPYNPEILTLIEEAKKQGRKVLLVTASSQQQADIVNQHLRLFDEAIGSSKENNLKGKHKADYLCQRFGEGKFDYAGNSTADIAIWKRSRKGIATNYPKKVAREARNLKNTTLLTPKKFELKLFLKTIRVHQYVKNLLIFLPLFLSFQFLIPATAWNTALAFIAFCLTASSVYALNDLLDIDTDRVHEHKKHRGFASGKLSIPLGIFSFICFLIAGLLLASYTSTYYLVTLCCYYILTLLYSFWLKRFVLIDAIVLGVLYTLRVFAGMVVISNGYSTWLLLFSLFIFTSLALAKRYTDQGYKTEQKETLKLFGITTGICSILIFSLYLNSARASYFYQLPELLILIIPILLYWITRIWLLADKQKIHSDPIMFAIKDKVTYISTGLIIIIVLLAHFI